LKLRRSGIIILAILLVIEVYIIATQWIHPLGWGIVPLTGWRGAITYPLFWLIWPLLGGMLLVSFMPRLLGPFFLKIKNAAWPDYTNSYIDLPNPELTQRRIIGRSLYMGLLVMGIVSILIYIVPYELLIPVGAVEEPTPLHLTSVASMAGLVGPFAMALWSVSWSFREASLVHYKIPDAGTDELYEIEPIHMRYDSFLKGYAGFSSLLFLVNLTLVYLSTREIEMAFMVLYVFMHICLLTLPSIYLHSKMNHMWLRRGLSKVRRITRDDVHILEE
jgi:hypothetical protein